jgi:hypothetical protein
VSGVVWFLVNWVWRTIDDLDLGGVGWMDADFVVRLYHVIESFSMASRKIVALEYGTYCASLRPTVESCRIIQRRLYFYLPFEIATTYSSSSARMQLIML